MRCTKSLKPGRVAQPFYQLINLSAFLKMQSSQELWGSLLCCFGALVLHLSFWVVFLGNGDLGDSYTSMHKRIFGGLCVFLCAKQSNIAPAVMALLTGNQESKGLDSSFLLEPQASHENE